MRRIFGGQLATTGSSPDSGAAGHAHQAEAGATAGPSNGLIASSPVDDSRRGWFTSSTRPSRNDSNAQYTDSDPSTPQRASSVAVSAGTTDFPDLDRLPFGRSTLSPSASSAHSLSNLANGGGRRSLGGSGNEGRPGSLSGGAVSEPSAVASGKDAMMIELLSGAALLEAAKYDVLDWEALQSTKKEHTTLSTRLTSLRRSLAVETRLRDSAAKLVRLSAPEGTAEEPPVSPSAASRPRVTRQQAEAQLALAQKKLDAAEQGVQQAAAREAELQTKLLAHTAGVLSLALRNRDAAAASAATTALEHDLPNSARTSAAHLYASHSRSIDSSTDQRSNRLEQDLAQEQDKTADLEQQVAQLEHSLNETKEHARVEMERLRDELARTQAAAASQFEESKRQVDDLEGEVDYLRNDLSEAAAEVDDLRRRLAALPSDGERRTVADLEGDLEMTRGEVKQLTEELEEAQGELETLKKVFEERLAAAEQDGARKAAEAASTSSDIRQRGAFTQAIGDVLRRHRMRPVLGTALRELPAFDDTSDRDDLVDYLSSTLDSHFERLSSHVNDLNEEISALSHERDSAETELEVLRSQAQDDAVGAAALTAKEADLATSRAAEQKAREEVAQARQRLDNLELQLREVEQDQVAVRELWTDLPRDGTSTPFSTGALVARVKALTGERESLRRQIEGHERDRAQAESARSEANQADSSRLRELEERVELSSQKEVSMLERLNDLTEALEATRAERRKLELRIAAIEKDKTQLEAELRAARDEASRATAAPAISAPAIGEEEVQELRDQIADLEEELSDAQKREQKTRASLLEELGQVQSEVSSLKTQLRQAQRKVGVKA
ncbi:hypothetical protein JCM10908_004875 [Rhodotorula pacifica]|uniref:uncharacterized protein n=1 Tax=Rhodotorula pacifica TaxID=1495444 RepID=UPI0031764443